MTLSRTCDACRQPIGSTRFLQGSLRLLRTDQGESQDALEEVYGDYCLACVKQGRKAITDLLNGFTKYPQQQKKG